MTLGIIIVTTGQRKQWLQEAYESALPVADQIEVVDNLYGPSKNEDGFLYHGIAESLNAGVQRLSTQYMMRLDDDNTLCTEMARMLKDNLPVFTKLSLPDVVTFPCNVVMGSTSTRWGSALNAAFLPKGNCVAAGCWFNRRAWDLVGGFEPMENEDWRFWLKLSRAPIVSFHYDQPIYNHRIHDDNLQARFTPEELAYWTKRITTLS